jgi:hypothetical protein
VQQRPQQQQQQPAQEESTYRPLNRQVQAQRETAVRYVSTGIFTGIEMLPTLLGVVDLMPYTQTLVIISGIGLLTNVISKNFLHLSNRFPTWYWIGLIGFNGLWYLYAKNHAMSLIDDNEDIDLPDLPETYQEPIKIQEPKQPIILEEPLPKGNPFTFDLTPAEPPAPTATEEEDEWLEVTEPEPPIQDPEPLIQQQPPIQDPEPVVQVQPPIQEPEPLIQPQPSIQEPEQLTQASTPFDNFDSFGDFGGFTDFGDFGDFSADFAQEQVYDEPSLDEGFTIYDGDTTSHDPYYDTFTPIQEPEPQPEPQPQIQQPIPEPQSP